MKHTKAQNIKGAYTQYMHSNVYTLDDCYNNYSCYKRAAYHYCLDLMHKYNGHSLKIISYNTTQFTAGFIGTVEGREAFVYITKSYDRYIFIDELT